MNVINYLHDEVLDSEPSKIEYMFSKLTMYDFSLVNYYEPFEHKIDKKTLVKLSYELFHELKKTYNIDISTDALNALFVFNNINTRKKVYVIAGYLAYMNKVLFLGGYYDLRSLTSLPMPNEKTHLDFWNSLNEFQLNNIKYKKSLIHE